MRKGKLTALTVSAAALAVGAVAAVAPAGSAATKSAAPAAPTVAIQPGVIHPTSVLAAPSQANCVKYGYYHCLTPGQVEDAYNLPPLYRQRRHRQGRDDRDRRLVRLAHDQARPRRLRPAVQAARAAVVPDHHPVGGDPEVELQRLRHDRLGRRDHPRRGVRAHDRPRRQHPAGRDAGVGDRGRDRLPADRQGRELRAQEPPRRRDQPELQRHRADLRRPQANRPGQPALRLHHGRGGEARTDRPGRLR